MREPAILGRPAARLEQSYFQYPGYNYPDSFEPPGGFDFDLADALCNVESVSFKPNFLISEKTTMRLVQNILTKNIEMKTLKLEGAIDKFRLSSGIENDVREDERAGEEGYF